MSYIIDLSPEEEARLQAAARRKGVAPIECVRQLLRECLPAIPGGEETDAARGSDRHFYETATPEEWEKAMDELAAGGEDLPDLSSGAFDRENLYEDRL